MSGVLELPPVVGMPVLRAAFPAYQFRIVMFNDKRRIEAILRHDAAGEVFCLIGGSREICIELMKSSSAAGQARDERRTFPLVPTRHLKP